MMFYPPFWNYQNQRRYGYYPYFHRPRSNPMYQQQKSDSNYQKKAIQVPPKKETAKPKEEPNIEKEKNSEKPLFELLGIKLYFDDILLVCLLFFFYKEEVEDQSLYLALILLLLS